MRLPTSALGWPAKMQTQDGYFLQACIETLLRSDGNSQPIPWLATGWKVADDRASMTLTLRKGVKFQDGTDFNADACRYNLNAVMAAKVPGTTGWSSVDVVDPYTVKINIKEWQNLIFGNLAGTAGMMVSPTSIEQNGVDWANTNMVGTGPFKFSKFERDTILEFAKWDGYWQTGKPYLDKIQYICIPDSVTQITTFKTGGAELIQPWNGQVMSELKQVPNTVFVYSHSGTFILYPDDANADSPFSKKEVRQAVEYAIDKESLMKVSGFGIFEAAYQTPVPGAVGYISSLPKRTLDLDKAKQLMAQAGYANGFECKLSITIPAPDIKDTQVALQAMLAKIGIKCDLEYADSAIYSSYMSKGWHDTLIYSPAYAAGNFLGSIQTYYTVPGYYVSLKGPANLMDMYKAAISTPDVDAKLVEKATQAMYDDDSLIPVNYMGTGQVYQDYVHDLGFGNKFASQMSFAPEDAWMSK
jgi:ABC-type transport system substrate-binding protein